jgi:hypothetical protein
MEMVGAFFWIHFSSPERVVTTDTAGLFNPRTKGPSEAFGE